MGSRNNSGEGRHGDDHKEGSDALAELITEVIAKRDAAQTSFWAIQTIAGGMGQVASSISLDALSYLMDLASFGSERVAAIQTYGEDAAARLQAEWMQAIPKVATHGATAWLDLKGYGDELVGKLNQAKRQIAYDLYVKAHQAWVQSGKIGEEPEFNE